MQHSRLKASDKKKIYEELNTSKATAQAHNEERSKSPYDPTRNMNTSAALNKSTNNIPHGRAFVDLGYEDNTRMISTANMMSRELKQKLKEATEVKQMRERGERPVTATLYDELSKDKTILMKKNKRDHLKDMFSLMQYNKVPAKSTYNQNFDFGDKAKEDVQNKDLSHHFKRDFFKVYTEAMLHHKGTLRKR